MDYEKGEKNKDLTFISLLNHKQRVFIKPQTEGFCTFLPFLLEIRPKL